MKGLSKSWKKEKEKEKKEASIHIICESFKFEGDSYPFVRSGSHYKGMRADTQGTVFRPPQIISLKG
jgi:hypothetical protein